MQTAKKKKTMPDFAAVKELVEQHVDFYRYSRASLVQALAIRRLLLELQDKLYLNHAHGPMAILLESTFRVSTVTLSLIPSYMALFSLLTFLNK